jgi:hypothetical protein
MNVDWDDNDDITWEHRYILKLLCKSDKTVL